MTSESKILPTSVLRGFREVEGRGRCHHELMDAKGEGTKGPKKNCSHESRN